MKNEPIAWLRYENEHWRLDFPMVRFYTNVETPEIPLYTTPELARKLHPSKTLTDEEIIEIWGGMETDTGEQNIAFARAILRKAQEK
jgi:hypothetical protein